MRRSLPTTSCSPPAPGRGHCCGAAPLAGVHLLRTIEDALALRTVLVPGVRLVVVGAGFIGSEVASSARTLGADVTVVEMLDVPLLAGPG